MRKLTAMDALGALLIAAVVVPFVGYSARGSVPFVQDARGMAGVGILGGLLAFAAFGRKAFGRGNFGGAMALLGLFTLGCVIAALIVGTSWALLAALMAGVVILGILALLHDAGYLAPRQDA